MGRILAILIILFPGVVAGQNVLSVDDLLTLTTLSPKNYDNYMSKRGFQPVSRVLNDNNPVISFFEKRSGFSVDSILVNRSVDLYKKDGNTCFVLRTTSAEEFNQGRSMLKKAGFFYDNTKDSSDHSGLLFQKRDITVVAVAVNDQEGPVYTFELKKKMLPDPGAIRFGEDLLKFDSHEHLVSFFGEQNVKEDVYYFSDTEKRTCSVIYPNSSQQAVFVWDDEKNLFKISFILIGGVLPTASAASYTHNISQNTWILRNGLYAGMRLKDLLKLNGNDFEFYGRNSEFAFLVEPEKTRNIDFKKVGIKLDCFDCRGISLLEREKVSASAAQDLGLALHVSCLMISP